MRLPTASSLWLAALCPASHVLPQTRMTSADMERGTAVHRYLERLPEVGRARALDEVPPEHREMCERIDPAQVPQGEREAAFAWNVDTGEVLHLGNGIGRDYTAALRRKLEERDDTHHLEAESPALAAVRRQEHPDRGRPEALAGSGLRGGSGAAVADDNALPSLQEASLEGHRPSDWRRPAHRSSQLIEDVTKENDDERGDRDRHQRQHPAPVRLPDQGEGQGALGSLLDAGPREGGPDADSRGGMHDVRGSVGVGGDLCPARWIFGTADVVEADGPVVVSDYKVTDVPIDARGLLKPAAQSHQLRFLALAVARLTGADAVEVAHLRVGSDGRIDGNDRAGLGYFDMAQVEEDVRGIVARVERAAAQAQPDLHPGDHCRFCPAAQRCPSTRVLIGQLIEDLDMAPLPVIADAVAWQWVKEARGALDLLDQELRRRAALAPICLPDGREVREVDVEQRQLDARTAFGVMRDAYGTARAWQAMETSKAAIQRVTGGGAGLRSVLKEIEARGGVTTTTVKQVKEVAPEPAEAPAELTTTWPEDMDPEDFTALHVGPARSES